jgi:aerobic carbon-monoxide dehydrogenase medium subunit
MIPGFKDLPRNLITSYMEEPAEDGEVHLGESAAPLISTAVYNACGVRIMALDAQVEVHGPNGTRTVPIEDFLLGFYETVLEPDEIVAGVRVPIPRAGMHAVYEKVNTRSSEDRPCLGVFAAVRMREDGKTCEDLRLAVGAATETPQRFSGIEGSAHGHELTEDVVGSVADRYAESTDPVEDLRGSAWYRTEMIRVWARRAIEHVREEAVSHAGSARRR